MPQHQQTNHSPHTPKQLFDLVADVDNYSEFLPWCSASRVTKREGDVLFADLIIRFKAFKMTYSSRVTLEPPKGEHDSCRIKAELEYGPFTHLINDWHFKPADDGGTEVEFDLDFAFESHMLENLVGSVFLSATKKMVAAFEERADTLYK